MMVVRSRQGRGSTDVVDAGAARTVTPAKTTGPAGPVAPGRTAGPAKTMAAGETTGVAPEWTPPSWDDLVRQHSSRVYRLAYRLTGNQHDAEDLTQEVFVRVFRSLASYTPGTFEGWLHRITTNLFLDMVRRRARIRMEALPEDSDRIA